MLVLILFLLLLAAALGVLGVVVKATLIIVLSVTLSIVLLAAIGYSYARRRMKRFMRELQPPRDPYSR